MNCVLYKMLHFLVGNKILLWGSLEDEEMRNGNNEDELDYLRWECDRTFLNAVIMSKYVLSSDSSFHCGRWESCFSRHCIWHPVKIVWFSCSEFKGRPSPPSQWCILHICPISAKFFLPYLLSIYVFVNLRVLASLSFVPWCIYASCFTHTGCPWWILFPYRPLVSHLSFGRVKPNLERHKLWCNVWPIAPFIWSLNTFGCPTCQFWLRACSYKAGFCCYWFPVFMCFCDTHV